MYCVSVCYKDLYQLYQLYQGCKRKSLSSNREREKLKCLFFKDLQEFSTVRRKLDKLDKLGLYPLLHKGKNFINSLANFITMLASVKYQLLDDELKTVRISGVLRGIPLTPDQFQKWERHVKHYGNFDFMEMPAVNVNELRQ